jgi:hypothetical protein
MKIRSSILVLSLLLMVSPSRANELMPETVKAWDQYVQSVNAQFRERVNRDGHLLRVEEAPDRLATLMQGQILAEPVAGNGHEKVPHGLIHDWYGAVFVPGATVQDVLFVLDDYDRYQEFYRPTVIDSKLLERTEDNEKFSMLMLSKVLFVTVALDAQYESHLTCLDEKRCYIVSHSVRTQQIKDYGRSNERTLPPDEGDGYLWRLYGITSFEERDGGVLIENESIGLSRDIPASVRWLVNPIVNRLPRNSMTTGLRQTRDAISAASAMESRARVTKPTDPAGYVQLSGAHRSALR